MYLRHSLHSFLTFILKFFFSTYNNFYYVPFFTWECSWFGYFLLRNSWNWACFHRVYEHKDLLHTDRPNFLIFISFLFFSLPVFIPVCCSYLFRQCDVCLFYVTSISTQARFDNRDNFYKREKKRRSEK